MAKEFTIFVDGLPNNKNSNWLKNIFKSKGEIVDVYIFFKKRKFTDSIFGFVRFQSEEDAKRAIASFDGKVLNSNTLKVKWAKYRRRGNGLQHLNDTSTQSNEHFKGFLTAILNENFGFFKRDLLSHIKETLVCTMKPLMEELSREACSSHFGMCNSSTLVSNGLVPISEASKNSCLDVDGGVGVVNGSTELEEDVHGKSDVFDMDKAQREIEEKDKVRCDTESELKSVSESESESVKPPMVSCYCIQSSKKEKKKMKRCLRRKQKHNLMDDCYLVHGGRWWLEEDFDCFDEDDLGNGRKWILNGKDEDGSKVGDDDAEQGVGLGNCVEASMSCVVGARGDSWLFD